MIMTPSTSRQWMEPFIPPRNGHEPSEPHSLRGVRILSLDNGGFRGLLSLFVLRELMKDLETALRKYWPLDDLNSTRPHLRPCDCFDLIVGTGMGGVSALLLGRLRLSVDDAITEYIAVAETALKPSLGSRDGQFEDEKLKQSMAEVVKRRCGHAGILMQADPREPTAPFLHEGPHNFDLHYCRTAVIAAMDKDPDPAYILRSYSAVPSMSTIVDVAHATCASAGIFPPCMIHSESPFAFTHVDQANIHNPAEIALVEAEHIWPEYDISFLLSIGTGKECNVVEAGNEWKKAISSSDDFIKSCRAVHRRLDAKYRQGPLRYIRLNPDGLDKLNIKEWTLDPPRKELQSLESRAAVLIDVVTAYLRGRSPAGQRLQLSVKIQHAHCEQGIATYYQQRGAYRQAIEAFSNGKDDFDATNDQLGVAQCLQSLGDIYSDQINRSDYHDRALNCYATARIAFLGAGDNHGATRCLQRLGDFHQDIHNNEAALSAYQIAKTEYSMQSDLHNVALCLENLGYVHQKIDQFPIALEAFTESRINYQTFNDQHGMARCLKAMGDIYKSFRDYDQALQAYSDADVNFQDMFDRPSALQCLKEIGEIYQTLRNSDKTRELNSKIGKWQADEEAERRLAELLVMSSPTRDYTYTLCPPVDGGVQSLRATFEKLRVGQNEEPAFNYAPGGLITTGGNVSRSIGYPAIPSSYVPMTSTLSQSVPPSTVPQGESPQSSVALPLLSREHTPRPTPGPKWFGNVIGTPLKLLAKESRWILTDEIRIIGHVAGGGHSDVHIGEFTRANVVTKVALKQLKVYSDNIPEHGKRIFRRELQFWSRLQHPNILPFLGCWELDDRCLYLVSPWASNGNSLEYVRKNPSADRRRILWETAEALAYLHSGSAGHALVHGDLKADNVLIADDGRALLADFGLTRHVEQLASISGTPSGINPFGHIRFCAPELLVQANSRPSGKSDTFAFACFALQLFTEKLPYAHVLSDIQVFNEIYQDRRPQRPLGTAVERGLNDKLWSLITECWRSDPDQRPTMNQVAQLLK